jgi:hypothetical protein
MYADINLTLLVTMEFVHCVSFHAASITIYYSEIAVFNFDKSIKSKNLVSQILGLRSLWPSQDRTF